MGRADVVRQGGARRVRIYDIASHAGVSPTTVSAMLTGKRPVSAETRARIEQSIAVLGYRANASARALAHGRTDSIALLIPPAGSSLSAFEVDFIAHVVQAARASDYDVLVSTSLEEEKVFARLVEEERVDGIILLEVCLEDRRVERLAAAGLPFVAVGRTADPSAISWVDIDFSSLVRAFVRHLSDLRHEDLVMFNSSRASYDRGYGPAHRAQSGFIDGEKASLDSVVQVSTGEHMSELEAIEAVLVPSADNIVRMLAIWDAGSKEAFVAKMNAQARRLGLAHTHYSGPSGVDPGSVSTASDQTRLAEIALRNPVIASIVSMPQVVLPVAGLQYNVDGDLGHDGIVGVKTGWVPQGGASFVFAARHLVAGHREMLFGAVVGVSNGSPLPTALADAEHLVRAADAGLSNRTVVSAGETAASLDAGYAAGVPLVAARSVEMVVWPGERLSQSVAVSRHLVAPIRSGARVGMLTVRIGSETRTVPLVARGSLGSASLGWRLTQL